MYKLNVLDLNISLTPFTKEELKGLSSYLTISYSFFTAEVNGQSLCFLQPKSAEANTPRHYSLISKQIEQMIKKSVVYIFTNSDYDFLKRLMKYGTYFIVPQKAVFLPSLYLKKHGVRSKYKQLSISAQVIILYHLIRNNLNGLTIKDIASLIPHKYSTIAKAFDCLEKTGLCSIEYDKSKQKHVTFQLKNNDLWNAALPFFFNPIQRILYCDEISSYVTTYACGISALTEYGEINPENVEHHAISTATYKKAVTDGQLIGMNDYDGICKIEIWKYDPVVLATGHLVDKLSLYLTLRQENDVRIKDDIEKMIHQVWL